MSIDALLQRGVDEGVYPLVRLEVFHRGRHVVSAGNARPECVFDLASVTKVMCTTALVMDLKLPLHARVRAFVPDVVTDATLEDLLFHRSGLPAFIPFFAEEMLANGRLALEVEPGLCAAVRQRVLTRAAGIAAVHPIGAQAVYSDVGFILLGAVLERVAGKPLDALFAERIAPHVEQGASYRRVSSRLPVPKDIAPTGTTRPREPAPGQEGMWNVLSVPSRAGEVDDDNAWCLDGVSGHAGLFGTALSVARFGAEIVSGRWMPENGWRVDATTPGSTRSLGFDTPSSENASCGQRFGRAGSRGAIGHLGFTGTSVWIDFDRELVVAFLTNRVALGRHNVRIREFRPLVHEAVLDALGA